MCDDFRCPMFLKLDCRNNYCKIEFSTSENHKRLKLSHCHHHSNQSLSPGVQLPGLGQIPPKMLYVEQKSYFLVQILIVLPKITQYEI